MLHNPLGKLSMPDHNGKQLAYTIVQLERAWRALSIDPAKARVAITELNPIASLTAGIDSGYDDDCRASMTAVLNKSAATKIVVFGRSAKEQWMNEVHLLPGVVSVEVKKGRTVQRLLTMADGRVVTVVESTHPSANHLFHNVLYAVADAHRLQVSEEAIQAADGGWSHISAIEVVPGAEFASITVDSEEKRFVLKDGTLTHNCQESGRASEGLQHVESALERNQLALGPDHVQVALSHHTVAVAYALLGEFRSSVNHEKMAKSIYLAALGNKHQSVVRSHLYLEHFTALAVRTQQTTNKLVETAQKKGGKSAAASALLAEAQRMAPIFTPANIVPPKMNQSSSLTWVSLHSSSHKGKVSRRQKQILYMHRDISLLFSSFPLLRA
jgi:hypothetical protein